MIKEVISKLIDQALSEDIGDGDHSSIACIPQNVDGKAQLLIKEAGIIAGLDIAEAVFRKVDKSIKLNMFLNDGSRVEAGDIGFSVEGPKQSLLKSERLVLNILQRMSGIATTTRIYVDKISDLKTIVLDTRKTTPGFRILEKEAVRLGGGENHRMGLYDMIMLKDNHIDFAGGIHKAIKKTITYLQESGKDLKIEIEARNIDEVKQILDCGGIDRIMLDNFSLEDTRHAVKIIDGRYETESSGGINLKTIRDYAECGVDYVSVGALTHQIKSLDISLKAI